MSGWLQEKYIKMCGLPLLTKNGNNYNFRCPICGDSKRKRTKRRGYLLLKSNSYIYYCHNCNVGKEGTGISFENFLKEYQPTLYRDYVKEKLFDKKKEEITEPKQSEKQKNFVSGLNILKGLERVVDIEKRNDIIDFLEERRLPSCFVKGLYYTYDFQKYVNEYIKTKFESPVKETRIVIPCFNKDKKLVALQGRSLYNIDSKYITITVIEEEIKLWNVDKINTDEDVYIFEGVFDACFIKNSVSTLGAGFNVDEIRKYIDKRVFVFDNDFRYNKQVKNIIEKVIDDGERVVILPKKIKEKDVNKMVQHGYSVKQVLKIIKENVYQGAEAKIRLSL